MVCDECDVGEEGKKSETEEAKMCVCVWLQVGTGRCLFALDWSEADYDELLKRMLKACEAMKAGGWWEAPKININAAVGKEFVVAILKSIVGF